MGKEGIIKYSKEFPEKTDKLGSLRYELTKHTERYLFTNENFYMLIHPKLKYTQLVCEVKDDIGLLPKIKQTADKMNIKFYKVGYNEEIYEKNELLAFIFASINKDWNIIEGVDKKTGKSHFWLKYDNVVFDPSLSIITFEELYSKYYEVTKEIENKDILNYLIENNNLYKFYNKQKIFFNKNKIPLDFSINFINGIREEFNKKVSAEYTLTKEKFEKLKKYFRLDDFIELRQVLSQKRKGFLLCNNIALHPDVDNSILKKIEKSVNNIYDLMSKEYGKHVNYYSGTIGNCYALSIMLNLFDSDFKLVQGYIPYEEKEFALNDKSCYLHSWTEIDNVVYDPALRVVTPKELYYKFAVKTDEYSKEQTENMLRRIGFDLIHFRAFLSCATFSRDQSIMSRFRREKIDSQEYKEQGEKLISLVKKYK